TNQTGASSGQSRRPPAPGPVLPGSRPPGQAAIRGCPVHSGPKGNWSGAAEEALPPQPGPVATARPASAVRLQTRPPPQRLLLPGPAATESDRDYLVAASPAADPGRRNRQTSRSRLPAPSPVGAVLVEAIATARPGVAEPGLPSRRRRVRPSA